MGCWVRVSVEAEFLSRGGLGAEMLSGLGVAQGWLTGVAGGGCCVGGDMGQDFLVGDLGTELLSEGVW